MAHKVLIINESALLVRFVRNVLKQRFPDVNVTSANRGAEGIRVARADPPDIILLDVALPDLKPEPLAAELRANEATGKVPIILTHRNATRVELPVPDLPNIVRTLPKPFTPEELLDIAGPLLAKPEPHPEPGPATKQPRRIATPLPLPSANPNVLFRGRTESFPLTPALHSIEMDQSRGVLRIFLRREPIQTYFDNGTIVLCTTRDVDLYSSILPGFLKDLPQDAIEAARQVQGETGCPLFLTLAERGALPQETAIRLARDIGPALFSKAWTVRKIYYEFERLDQLPEFAARVPPIAQNAYQWTLATLRHLGATNADDDLGSEFDPKGVPVYSPEGYALIQELQLSPEETRFAANVNNANSLSHVASKAGLPIAEARRQLFKFLSLEIMDFWSPDVFSP